MPYAPIEFWFDFSSGYAYFAAYEIDAVAERHGRSVLWRPYMLGAAFKLTGARGLSGTPVKGDYARHDWARLSKLTGRPFRPPSNHPITALPASRAYYWVEEHFPDKAVHVDREVAGAPIDINHIKRRIGIEIARSAEEEVCLRPHRDVIQQEDIVGPDGITNDQLVRFDMAELCI